MLIRMMNTPGVEHSLENRLYGSRIGFPKIDISDADLKVLQGYAGVRVGRDARADAQAQQLTECRKWELLIVDFGFIGSIVTVHPLDGGVAAARHGIVAALAAEAVLAGSSGDEQLGG